MAGVRGMIRTALNGTRNFRIKRKKIFRIDTRMSLDSLLNSTILMSAFNRIRMIDQSMIVTNVIHLKVPVNAKDEIFIPCRAIIN